MLQFPTALPERLGLALADHLKVSSDQGAALCKTLAGVTYSDAAEEMAAIASLLRPVKPTKPAQNVPRAEHLPNGLKLALQGEKIVISGKPVSDVVFQKVLAALKND